MLWSLKWRIYFILFYFILIILFYFILFYFTLFYFILLYFTLLYFTLLYFTLLYFTLLYFTLLYFTLLYFTLLYFICFIIIILMPKRNPFLSHRFVKKNLKITSTQFKNWSRCPLWKLYLCCLNLQSRYTFLLWFFCFDGNYFFLERMW